MRGNKVTKEVGLLAEPILGELGLELVGVEYPIEPVGRVLRLYVDRREGKVGVDVDTLAKVSEALSYRLDDAGIIEVGYNLEVSSPGVERPLTRPEHYKRFEGDKVKVRFVAPQGGRRQATGRIKEADDAQVVLELDEGDLTVDYEMIRTAHLVFEWKP